MMKTIEDESMYRCPKCSSTRIGGPRYVKTDFGERLRYECFQCGYQRLTPTDDAPVSAWGEQPIEEPNKDVAG